MPQVDNSPLIIGIIIESNLISTHLHSNCIIIRLSTCTNSIIITTTTVVLKRKD